VTRTPPAYTALAYRKAILTHTIQGLLRDYVGVGGVPGSATIICDDVFACDAEVSADAVYSFVEALQAQELELGAELKKFDFLKKPDAAEPPPESPPPLEKKIKPHAGRSKPKAKKNSKVPRAKASRNQRGGAGRARGSSARTEDDAVPGPGAGDSDPAAC